MSSYKASASTVVHFVQSVGSFVVRLTTPDGADLFQRYDSNWNVSPGWSADNPAIITAKLFGANNAFEVTKWSINNQEITFGTNGSSTAPAGFVNKFKRIDDKTLHIIGNLAAELNGESAYIEAEITINGAGNANVKYPAVLPVTFAPMNENDWFCTITVSGGADIYEKDETKTLSCLVYKGSTQVANPTLQWEVLDGQQWVALAANADGTLTVHEKDIEGMALYRCTVKEKNESKCIDTVSIWDHQDPYIVVIEANPENMVIYDDTYQGPDIKHQLEVSAHLATQSNPKANIGESNRFRFILMDVQGNKFTGTPDGQFEASRTFTLADFESIGQMYPLINVTYDGAVLSGASS